MVLLWTLQLVNNLIILGDLCGFWRKVYIGIGGLIMVVILMYAIIDGFLGLNGALLCRPNALDHSLYRVSNLLDHANRVLKHDLIDALFVPTNADLVKSINLSLRTTSYMVLWPHEKNGFYSVRSAYHFIRRRMSTATTSTVSPVWKKIWNLKLTPKLKHFAWRLVHDVLSVKTNLSHRGVFVDVVCLRCGNS